LAISTNYARFIKLLKNIPHVSYELPFFTNSFMRLNRLRSNRRLADDQEINKKEPGKIFQKSLQQIRIQAKSHPAENIG